MFLSILLFDVITLDFMLGPFHWVHIVEAPHQHYTHFD